MCHRTVSSLVQVIACRPVWLLAIILTNADMISVGSLGTNFSGIWTLKDINHLKILLWKCKISTILFLPQFVNPFSIQANSLSFVCHEKIDWRFIQIILVQMDIWNYECWNDFCEWFLLDYFLFSCLGVGLFLTLFCSPLYHQDAHDKLTRKRKLSESTSPVRSPRSKASRRVSLLQIYYRAADENLLHWSGFHILFQ